MEFKYVSIDVETTGLSSESDEILEVAAIEFDEATGTRGRRIVKFCRPIRGLIPEDATRIHGITMEMVKGSKVYLTEGVQEEIAQFVGQRTIIGHNVIKFDLLFLKIKPVSVRDTLQMCRSRFSGSNKLKTACMRLGIVWTDDRSHRAEYDAERTIDLFLKIRAMEDRESTSATVPPLIAAMMQHKAAGPVVMGVVPSDADKSMMATQAYSFSRIELFHQCPFKWYMKYIRKMKEPDYSYFQIGKICHRVAELANKLCVRMLFANKFEAYVAKKPIQLPDRYVDIVREIETSEKCSREKAVGMFLFDNRQVLKDSTSMGYAHFMNSMDAALTDDEYEKPSMPSRDDYARLINKAVAEHKCEDGMVISEVQTIMWRFYNKNDFTLYPGEISVTEQKLAFDKDWNLIDDFYASNVFFRGIIDVIDYSTGIVTITDYKTSRKMMTKYEVMNDMQTKIYLSLVHMMLPKDSFSRAIIRINYVRYGTVIQLEIEDVKAVVDSAMEWIRTSIQDIEKEMLKTDGTSFSPIRNEYCHACFLSEDGICPLFNKKFVGSIDDPMGYVVDTVDKCREAWKRIEANKAEITRLAKQCKSFVKSCDAKIQIDEHATLDFWVEKTRTYDPIAAITLLKSKGVDGKYAMKFCSLPKSDFEKLLQLKQIELTPEEIESISSTSTKSSFDALTAEEATNKGFLNA